MSSTPNDDDPLGSSAPHDIGIRSAVGWLPGTDAKPGISLLNRSKPSNASLLARLTTPAIETNQNAFSCSLPALLHDQSNAGESLDTRRPMNAEAEGAASEFLDIEAIQHTIGDLLPDEEELFAGIVDGFYSLNLSSNMVEEGEEFDLFSSGGGLELDGDTQDSLGAYSDNCRGSLNGFSGSFGGLSNGVSGSIIGEHPFGEHPSRTLFVRNINSNVEDAELRALFEHYGAIRTLYTACKHRGFVMISYYDIRAARNAMRALQNKPLRRRKLDIHFSIPKDNPSDKDVNQGTLVVFNLDASVSNDDLRQIFGQYGEVKEIRETPHKRHHKFIEFYDVRAAEAALKALNRSDIAGKRIKLEPSRPGGARRSLIQQHGQDAEQDDTVLYEFSYPLTFSPPGNLSSWTQFGSPLENSPMKTLQPSLGTIAPSVDKPVSQSSSLRVGTIGSHLGRMGSVDVGFSSIPPGAGVQAASPHRAHSLPDYSHRTTPFLKPPVPLPVGGMEVTRASYDVDGLPLPKPTTGDVDYVSLYEQTSGGLHLHDGGSLRRLNPGSVGATSLSGPQFLWGHSSPRQPNSSLNGWAATPPMGPNFHPSPHSQMHGQPRSLMHSGVHGRSPIPAVPPHRYHLGSAPSGELTFLDKHFGFRAESPDMNYNFHPSSLAPAGVHGSIGSPSSVLSMNMNSGYPMLNSGSLGISGGRFEGGISVGIPPHRRIHIFQTGGIPLPGSSDGQTDRGRIRRRENSNMQLDSNRQYQLDIERILRGEDTRTTLMIKNIPNKYTSKMLLAAIDENHRKTYDFLYLPIDFKNKCNVGYAFINMTSPAHIIPLYQAFNGKKWEKFNSEKVASLAYARIQGKAALVAHFQNSSLMNEDKRCRPILFDFDGPETGEQELAIMGGNTTDMTWREADEIVDSIKLKREDSKEDQLVPEDCSSSMEAASFVEKE